MNRDLYLYPEHHFQTLHEFYQGFGKSLVCTEKRGGLRTGPCRIPLHSGWMGKNREVTVFEGSIRCLVFEKNSLNQDIAFPEISSDFCLARKSS